MYAKIRNVALENIVKIGSCVNPLKDFTEEAFAFLRILIFEKHSIMKIIPCVFLLIIIASCTQQGKPAETIAEGTDQPASSQPSVDDVKAAGDVVASQELPFHADSTFYIGFVHYFPETKEFYTSLYYRADEADDGDALDKLLDSTVYEDQETSRKRLPLTVASQWFVTEDIHKLFIYNSQHERVTTASLVRIEKLDGPLESEFIAVYKPETVAVEDNESYYGITSEKHGYQVMPVSIQEVEDPELDQAIMQHLKLGSQDLRMSHYRIQPGNSVYSAVSSDREAYITELKESNLKVLAERHDDTFFAGILPLPIQVSERPLLLVNEAVQESDVAWSYLAVFQDSAYVPANRGRMRIRYEEE